MLKQFWNRGVVKKISLCDRHDTFWNVISVITQQSYLFNDISTKSVRVEIIFRIYMVDVISALLLGHIQFIWDASAGRSPVYIVRPPLNKQTTNIEINKKFTVALHLWLMPPWAGVHRSKLHLRVLLQGLLRKSILIKRSLRWGEAGPPDHPLNWVWEESENWKGGRMRRTVRNPLLLK